MPGKRHYSCQGKLDALLMRKLHFVSTEVFIHIRKLTKLNIKSKHIVISACFHFYNYLF